MTNTAISDQEIVARIRDAGWWQGSIADAEALAKLDASLPPGFDYWVVATQTCNLYNKNLEKVAKVEWIGARDMRETDPLLRGGRNPRTLEAKATGSRGELWIVCDSQERHWGPRACLAKLTPTMALVNAQGLSQSERHKDNFAAWLARGYTRLELSDELGKALNDGKFLEAMRKLAAAHEADIFGMFIHVSDEQNNPPEKVLPPCDVELTIVVSRAVALNDVANKLTELFDAKNLPGPKGKISRVSALRGAQNVRLVHAAVPSGLWTVDRIEQTLRLNFNDYYSGPQQDGEA